MRAAGLTGNLNEHQPTGEVDNDVAEIVSGNQIGIRSSNGNTQEKTRAQRVKVEVVENWENATSEIHLFRREQEQLRFCLTRASMAFFVLPLKTTKLNIFYAEFMCCTHTTRLLAFLSQSAETVFELELQVSWNF